MSFSHVRVAPTDGGRAVAWRRAVAMFEDDSGGSAESDSSDDAVEGRVLTYDQVDLNGDGIIDREEFEQAEAGLFPSRAGVFTPILLRRRGPVHWHTGMRRERSSEPGTSRHSERNRKR